MINEQDEHVEDQMQTSHAFTYWMSPQRTAATELGRQHLYRPRTNEHTTDAVWIQRLPWGDGINVLTIGHGGNIYVIMCLHMLEVNFQLLLFTLNHSQVIDSRVHTIHTYIHTYVNHLTYHTAENCSASHSNEEAMVHWNAQRVCT